MFCKVENIDLNSKVTVVKSYCTCCTLHAIRPDHWSGFTGSQRGLTSVAAPRTLCWCCGIPDLLCFIDITCPEIIIICYIMDPAVLVGYSYYS